MQDNYVSVQLVRAPAVDSKLIINCVKVAEFVYVWVIQSHFSSESIHLKFIKGVPAIVHYDLSSSKSGLHFSSV